MEQHIEEILHADGTIGVDVARTGRGAGVTQAPVGEDQQEIRDAKRGR